MTGRLFWKYHWQYQLEVSAISTAAEVRKYLEELHACFPHSLYDAMTATQRGMGFVLSFLENTDGDVCAGDLAEQLNVSSARIAALLNKMEQNGLISRRKSPEDKRRTLVNITPAGTCLIDGLRSQALNRVAQLLAEIGEKDLRSFIRVSRKIREVLQD